jgi:hypothetical protein
VFLHSTRLFGEIQATPPSPVHSITCVEVKDNALASKYDFQKTVDAALKSAKEAASKLDALLNKKIERRRFSHRVHHCRTLHAVANLPLERYRVALATRESDPPSATLAANNVQLIKVEELIGGQYVVGIAILIASIAGWIGGHGN